MLKSQKPFFPISRLDLLFASLIGSLAWGCTSAHWRHRLIIWTESRHLTGEMQGCRTIPFNLLYYSPTLQFDILFPIVNTFQDSNCRVNCFPQQYAHFENKMAELQKGFEVLQTHLAQ